MANNDNNSLQIEDEMQEQDAIELSPEDDWEKDNESASLSKKKQILNDKKRGQVRRNIEEIKEKRRLKELLGDDYEDFDYSDN